MPSSTDNPIAATPDLDSATAPPAASAPVSVAAPTAPATPASTMRLGFDNGLDGWSINQVGGSPEGGGSVAADTAGSAVLHEGDSFLVTLQQKITIPDKLVAINFVYAASFDTTDPNFINDAFEVALTDGDGYSVVGTFGDQRDAFFNLTEGLPAALGTGTAQTPDSRGQKVTLDISDVPVGTEATLTFRLVNNDGDTQTTVTIFSVDVLSPEVTIGLQNDTAPDGPGSEPYRTDLLTNDPTVAGTATDDAGVAKLEAQVDDGTYLDITAALSGTAYTFDPGPLSPGPHRITIRATDGAGNTGAKPLDFRVNAPPVADAGGNRTADEGNTLTFDGSGSSDTEDALYAYLWTFLDGSTVAGPSASHTYPQDGLFAASLTVTDTAGSVDTDAIQILVSNLPPTVVTASDLTGWEGADQDFIATFSDPGALDTHTAVVHWSDGSTTPGAITETGGQGTVTASHVYADNGVYPIRVDVTDNGGATLSRQATATIGNVPPSVTAAAHQTVDEGSPLQLTVATFTDPGFANAAAGTQETFTATIDWGDNGPVQSGTVSVVQGSAGTLTTGAVGGGHTYLDDGTYTVTVAVTDDDGGMGTATFTVTVNRAQTSSLGGYVYLDVNDNGVKDPQEQALPNVPITLSGPVSRTIVSAADGSYRFDELPSGTYAIAEAQPLAFEDGRETQGTPRLGSVGNDRFYGIELPPDVQATNYNFGECGLRAELITKQFLLASTPPAGELVSRMMVEGERWFAFQASSDGRLTAAVPRGVADPLIEIYTAGMLPVALSAGQHELSAAVEQGSKYILYVAGQAAEAEFEATLQLSEFDPTDIPQVQYTTNPQNALDVTGDGVVTPLDVLAVVNALNSGNGAEARQSGYYLDVNSDGLLTPLDALQVINALNAAAVRVTSFASAAGESSSAAASGIVAPTGAWPATTWFVPGPATAEGEAPPASPPQTAQADSLLDDTRQAVFTTSEDFQLGTFFNVNTSTLDELQLNAAGEIRTFPFIWISNSADGTVSRFDTRTGLEVGRYRTGPTSGTDPSRVAVTPEGNAWVANRADSATAWGNAVKILATGFIDRNGNGVVDTCQDLNGDGYITGNEILPWDANGDGLPDDERIALVVHVGRNRTNPNSWQYGGGARGIAVDTHGKLWVGLYNHQQYEVFDEATGLFEKIVPVNGIPYGAVIAPNGILYSASAPSRYLDAIDTATQQYLGQIDLQSGMYGITVDSRGVVWCSPYQGNQLIRYDTNTGEVNLYATPYGWESGGGIAVDRNGNVWAGKHDAGYLMKWEFAQDGKTLLTSSAVPVPDSNGSAKSAAVDADGYIWTVSYSPKAFKIDPVTNQVVMTVTTGSGPYNYSDMTGAVRIGPTERTGTWTEIFDSQQNAQPWGTIAMHSVAPTGSAIELRARASDNRNLLEAASWSAVNPDEDLHRLRGRYLQVQVRLTSIESDATPSVQDLLVAALPPPIITVSQPADGGEYLAGQRILLSGTATAATRVGPAPTAVPNRITAVYVNGTPVEVLDAGGNFFVRVDVLPGRNTFDVTAIDVYGQSASTNLTVDGTQQAGGNVDLLFDVSPSFAPDYARTSFDEQNKLLYAELAIHNVGQYAADNPFYVGIRHISEPSVTVADPAGTTRDGTPYFNFSPAVPGESLTPGEITGLVNAVFHNPNRVPFKYDLVFLAQLNGPPVFTTAPVVETFAGRTYTYDSDATDPDGDTLTYSLVSAPQNLQITPATGLLTWLPTLGDLGVHAVVIRAEDGRGGAAEQRYLLSVVEAPPNRPPYFTSLPVTEATVGGIYRYDADAVDPDSDPITYNLSRGATYSGVVLADAPVGYWRLGEASGSTAIDRSGNQQDATYSGAVTLARPGALLEDADTAVKFDGTTGQLTLPYTAPKNNFTIEAWVQTSATHEIDGESTSGTAGIAGQHFLFAPDHRGAEGGAGVSIGTNGISVYEHGVSYLPATAVYAGNVGSGFVHVVVTYANKQPRIYLNGTLVRTGLVSPKANVWAPTQVGLGSYGALAGTVDEVALYDSPLTPDQILRHYERGRNGLPLPAPPAGMSINPTTGEITWAAPTAADVGSHAVAVAASDGRGGVDTQIFVVRVQPQPGNHPPVIVSEPVTAFVPDLTYRYDVNAVDPDYDVLDYALTQSPDGMAIHSQTGMIEWKPTPEVLSKHQVTFADGQFNPADWEMTTFAANNIPSISSTQVSDGGDPGAFESIDFTLGTAASQNRQPTALQFFRKAGATYSPQAQGEIYSVDYAEDSISIVTPSGASFGQSSGPGLLQDGKVYVALFATGQTTSWTANELRNLSAEDFSLVSLSAENVFPDDEQHPDFSDDAPPIQFGFCRYLGDYSGGGGYRIVAGIDNWTVRVTPVLKTLVTVRVDDGKGGQDTQRYDLSMSRSGGIAGFKFSDVDQDGLWDRPSDLVVNDQRFYGANGELIDVLQPASMVSAIGPDGNLYGADGGKNRVLKYDGATGRYLGIFAQGPELNDPLHLTFGPDGSLYVANEGDDNILRYDGRTGAFRGVFASSPDLDLPYRLTFGPDGNLYVSSAARNQILRFDGVTGRSLGTFASGAAFASPSGLKFGPDGYLYVGNYQAGNVLRLDGNTGALVGEFVPSGRGGLQVVTDLSFGPDGNLYVASALGHGVFRFNGTTGAFVDRFIGGDILFTPYSVLFAGSKTVEAEPSLAGWTVYLDQNRNGRRDDGEPETSTDLKGHYRFDELAPGTYWVAEEPQPGWKQTAPVLGPHRITVEAGKTVFNVDFGNAQSSEALGNLPPVFTTDPNDPANPKNRTTIGSLYRYDADAFDANGDPLTFDLPLAPDGMTVHPERGIVVWQPTRDQAGTHQVVLRVQDGRGGIDLQSFTIDVVPPNTAPVITSTPPGPAVVGQPYVYQVQTQDAEGDTISFRLESPLAGMSIDASTGQLTWTPTAQQAGGQGVTVVAADSHDAQTQQIFTLQVVAFAPNGPPTITSKPRVRARVGQTYAYAIAASDPNGDPLSYSLDAAPSGMTVDAAGIVRWQAAPALLGTSQPVTVRVADGRGGSATQSYDLQVVSQDTNSPPRVVSTPPLTGIVGRTYVYNLQAEDPEGDPVIWNLDKAPAGMSIDPLRGTLRWTPAADQVGPQAVLVRVQDIFLAAATQSFTINVRAVNLPPQITSNPPTAAGPDEPYVYAVRATDPDHDPLAFRLSTAPVGMSIDAQTGLIQWTPAAAQIGSRPVVIVVDDGQGGIDTQGYVISVGQQAVNRPPVITSTPVYNAVTGRLYQYAVTATDPEAQAIAFSLEGKPDGMAIDPATGLITWTPTTDQQADHTVLVVATDAAGGRATQSYLLVVRANQAPVISQPENETVTAGATYRYDVRATDPERDPITFTLGTHLDGLTMDAAGRIAWNPVKANEGLHAIEVIATDSFGAASTASYQLTVTADTDEPHIALTASSTLVDLGGQVTFYVQATDNVGVASLALTVGGVPVALDGNNNAIVRMDQAGRINAVASATDAAGNVGNSDPRQVRVFNPADKEHPVVTINALIPQVRDQATGGLKDGQRIEGEALSRSPVLSYLTDVEISITDDNMGDWRIEYAPTQSVDTSRVGAADPDYVLLAEGTGVLDHRRFQIDTTRMANDAYLLRVLAYDNGQGWAEPLFFGVSSNAKLGNFTFTLTDFSMSLAGIPIQVSRTYDTLQAGIEGDFGYAWSMAVGAADIAETTPAGSEMQSGDRVYLTNPEGKRIGFTYQPTYESGWFAGTIAHPAFTADPGVTDKLSVKEGSYGVSEIIGAFDGAWNPSQYVLTTREGTVYEYVQGKGLQKITDRNRNVVTFTTTAITHSAGAKIDLVRDFRGRIKEIVDTAGNSIKYTYDAVGNLASFTNQLGETTRYVYRNAPAHFLEAIDNADNVRIFEAAFDDDGRLTGTTDALGNLVQQDFNPAAFTGTITDAQQNVTELLYNDRGNVLEKREPNSEDPAQPLLTKYEYGDSKNPDKETKIIDRRDVIETRQYDAAGNMTRVKRAVGTPQESTTDYTYDVRGNVLTIRQNAVPPTVFSYTAAGKLSKIVNAAGVTATATYDTQGRQASFSDFNGNATTYDYTGGCACGSPRKTTNPDGTYQLFEYNGYGQVTKEETHEANGTLVEIRTTKYDNLGRVVEERQGQGADEVVTRKVYKENLVDWEIIVNPASPNESPATPLAQRTSRITDYDYDAAGRLIKQTDAEGGVVQFRYDANGNRVLLQDPVGNITTWVYDALNRTVEERDPFYWVDYVQVHPASFTGLAGDAFLVQIVQANTEPSGASAAQNLGAEHVTVYAYDGEANRTKIIDRDGRLREFDYDPLGRNTIERWYAPDSTLVRTISSTYDTAGNLLTISDPDSTYTYTYDTLNRVKTVDNAGTPDMPQVVFSYDYDAMGNVTKASDNLGVSVVSTYDSRNRLETRRWEGAVDPAQVDFFYTAAGREKQIDRYADLARTKPVGSTDRTYDLAGRSKDIVHRNAVDAVLAEYHYQYDFAGLLDHEDRQGDWHADYTYDRTGQLLGADYSGADVAPEQVDEYYRYDANGNRTASYLHGTGYQTGTANQLLSDGTYNYAYDGEGNMVKKTEIATGKVTIFEYDHCNRMTRAIEWSKDEALGGVILHEESYRYDGFGRRIAILADGEVTKTIYNGDNAWADFSATNVANARYLFSNMTDHLSAQYAPGDGVNWSLTDRLGTVREVVGPNGQVINRIVFSAFGEVLGQRNPALLNRYLFTGREHSPGTELYYYRARFYDPMLGRFLSQDPLKFGGQDLSLYRYVRNTPLNDIDPHGKIGMVGVILIVTMVSIVSLGVSVRNAQQGKCSFPDASEKAADVALDIFGSTVPGGTATGDVVYIQCRINRVWLWLGALFAGEPVTEYGPPQ